MTGGLLGGAAAPEAPDTGLTDLLGYTCLFVFRSGSDQVLPLMPETPPGIPHPVWSIPPIQPVLRSP